MIRNLLDIGVRVPEDVSVIGFDDWDITNNVQPIGIGLTTVRQDFLGLGALAANLLLMTVKGVFSGSGIRALQGVEFIRRESTASI
jgi:LacI family transcriptional regulator